MTKEKWYYLKQYAEKNKARFLRCDSVLYEVTKSNFATGRSLLWHIEEVLPVDVPTFIPDPDWSAGLDNEGNKNANGN